MDSKNHPRIRLLFVMAVDLVKHIGGCHCGKVRFEILAKPVLKAWKCNCTICVKKGITPVLVPEEYFKLLQGEGHISCYTYNTHQAKHYFCTTCGIHAFYRPRSNPKAYGISLHCLDGGTVQKIDTVVINALDWENWEKYLMEHPGASNYTDNVQ
nr:centromere protein V-like [Pocillopora verrucosa]